jgi:hypothetical protein
LAIIDRSFGCLEQILAFAMLQGLKNPGLQLLSLYVLGVLEEVQECAKEHFLDVCHLVTEEPAQLIAPWL